MPRVSEETVLSDLPKSAQRTKCALCNETLTHLVKKAEVETGAGTATVTRVLAEKINEDVANGLYCLPAIRGGGERIIYMVKFPLYP